MQASALLRSQPVLLDLPDEILHKISASVMKLDWSFYDFGMCCKRMSAILLQDRARVTQAAVGKQYTYWEDEISAHAFWCSTRDPRMVRKFKTGLLRNAWYKIKRGRFRRLRIECSLSECQEQFGFEDGYTYFLNPEQLENLLGDFPINKLVMII